MIKKEKISKAKSPETVKKRKKAKDETHENEGFFRNFMENAPDGVFICDFNGTFLYGNRKSEKIVGYDRDELIGKNLLESNLLTEKDLNKALNWLKENMKGNPTGPDEIELITKEGRIIPVEIHTSVVQHMGQESILAFVRDITARKKAEEMIRQVEEKYRTILESFQEGYFEVDLKGNFTFCNDSMSRIIGYSKEELLGMNYRVFEDEETTKIVYQEFNKVYKTGEPAKGFDHPYIRKDGTKTYVETSIILQKDSSGKPTGFKGMVRDISERKLVEKKLVDSEEKFRMLAESSSFAIGMHQGDRWIYANRAAEEISGYTEDELFRMHFWDFVHPDYQDMVKQNAYNRQMGKILPRDYDFKIIAKNGTEKWVNLTGNRIKYEDKPTAVVSITDITERKHAEEELVRLNRSLRMLSDINQALIHITNEIKLLDEVCRIAVEVGGYRMAWVGSAQNDEEKTVRPLAHAGFESGYIESANITWADNERGRGPIGTAIRTGQPSITRNIPQDPAFALWRESAMQRGYKSNIALPIISEGQTLGALTIYSAEADAFDANEVEILKELADDLTFGISALRTRVKRKQTEAALSESEERYRLIAENTADTINVFDLNFNKIYVSPSILKLRGYTVQESITQTLDQMLTPDSLEQAIKVFTEQMALESSGTADPARTALMELEEYCKDGSTIWVEVALSFLRDNNLKPTGILTVTRNITERKRTEEKLQETLEVSGKRLLRPFRFWCPP